MPGTNTWTREQVLIALNLYCQLPFGKLDARTPVVAQVAELLGRTPGSLSMKLNNLASFDPAITATGRVGLKGASALDRKVWNEFMADPDRVGEESQQLMDALVQGTTLDSLASIGEEVVPPTSSEETTTTTATVKVRRGQTFFRRAVLASYQCRCCMSGLQTRPLLVASHIKPWNKDVANRLNPRNGLCLSALHDRAYDLGLISVRPDFTIAISKTVALDGSDLAKRILGSLEGQAITLPDKFWPDPAHLDWHYSNVFQQA